MAAVGPESKCSGACWLVSEHRGQAALADEACKPREFITTSVYCTTMRGARNNAASKKEEQGCLCAHLCVPSAERASTSPDSASPSEPLGRESGARPEIVYFKIGRREQKEQKQGQREEKQIRCRPYSSEVYYRLIEP